MDVASKLFEKFNREVNRQTQFDSWNEVISRLSDTGIYVPGVGYLRKRIANWIQRATVCSINFPFILLIYPYKVIIFL